MIPWLSLWLKEAARLQRYHIPQYVFSLPPRFRLDIVFYSPSYGILLNHIQALLQPSHEFGWETCSFLNIPSLWRESALVVICISCNWEILRIPIFTYNIYYFTKVLASATPVTFNICWVLCIAIRESERSTSCIGKALFFIPRALISCCCCCCWCIQPALFAGSGHFLDRPVGEIPLISVIVLLENCSQQHKRNMALPLSIISKIRNY